ncbi:MAG TPA: integrase [Steroidobacter sp.]|uniref:integrase n=1 Tax=Steroidobacter sp. TaxID=1978227 RepID=UPI002ED98321
MADVIHFTPRAELNAEANLRDFIEVCKRQLTIFGADLNFDDNVWDVTEAIGLRRSSRVRLVFSTWSTVNDSVPQVLPEPFLSFAKAYTRYQHAFRPTKVVGQRMAALRALEAALSENGSLSNPVSVSPHTLNRAAQLCVDKFTAANAFRVGGQLEMLCNFMVRNHLLATPVRWRNSIKRPRDSVRVGKEFDEQRHAKLPSPAALSALANIFHIATEPADILVASIVAILCSAPDRISEALYLEIDCEATQSIPPSGEQAYGLRWRPAKGADPMVKWIIPSMADVVKQAIANIKRVTEPARLIAKWYEAHPTELLLPRHIEYLRGSERISLDQVGEIVFADPVERRAIQSWCARNGVELITMEGGEQMVRFADVEAALVAQLPRGFPWLDEVRSLKYSQALCLTQRNLFHDRKATYRGVVEIMNHQHVSDRLGARPGLGVRSLFERYGFAEDDGSALRVSTHQFRHYLNTLAQAGGLSQLDIAKWSGRKDVRQNRTYDHQSDRDVLALVRSVVGDEKKAVGPLARVHPSALIPRDEFARLKVPTAHTTEFGYCIHDFSMLPCQIHRDCLNCSEQVCIKGDAVREANIRRHRAETRQLLDEAKAASANQYAGSNRWVEHQERTLTRLEQLCAILDDPNVPAGAVIQPSGVVPASRLEQARSQRALSVSANPASAGDQLIEHARLPAPINASEEELQA